MFDAHQPPWSPHLLTSLLQVKRDHHELFKQYAPIWAKEEVERASLWTTFLLSFAPGATGYQSLLLQMDDDADGTVAHSYN
jgi:hypothetical protein